MKTEIKSSAAMTNALLFDYHNTFIHKIAQAFLFFVNTNT